MSPESLLLNALKCHLVFAGSLQLTEGWGEFWWEELWGECRQRTWRGICDKGALASIVPNLFMEDIVVLRMLFCLLDKKLENHAYT